MKIGKQPKRFGGPSKAFLERKRQERLAKTQIIPREGDVRVYLDDERACPEGWTLTKTWQAFFELLDADHDRITEMSLDYYLGSGKPDGEEVALRLADKFMDNPQYLPNLRVIQFHSSDVDYRLAMLRTIHETLESVGRDNIYLRL